MVLVRGEAFLQGQAFLHFRKMILRIVCDSNELEEQNTHWLEDGQKDCALYYYVILFSAV